MKYFVPLLLVIILTGCGTKKSKDLQNSDTPLVGVTEIYDTMIIDRNIAVIWWPDSNDQVVMKENYDEISYNTFVDDLTWYTQKAVEMLDSFNIENRVTDKDVIVFKKNDEQEVILKRKEIKGNMVLFNVNKEPLVANVNEYNRKLVIEFFK